jgi:hypothetical protein
MNSRKVVCLPVVRDELFNLNNEIIILAILFPGEI